MPNGKNQYRGFRPVYQMPKFDEKGNKIDPNKQQVITGSPFSSGLLSFGPTKYVSAAQGLGGITGQLASLVSDYPTIKKGFDSTMDFFGLGNDGPDVSNSPNVIAANQKPSTGLTNKEKNIIYGQRLANENDLTSKTRYRPPEDTPLEEPTFTPTGGNNIGDASESSMASTTRMPKKQVFNLTSKGAQTVDTQSLIPTGEDMIKTGKEASEARMKAAERSTSKNRFGLFGNYGKDVEIKKVRDASTGLISKQKFVDGKRVQSGKERRAARKAFRRFK